MNKNEVLQEHAATWASNGLSDLTYTQLRDVRVGCVGGTGRAATVATAAKVTVDIHLNQHWTDTVCTNDSQQLDVTPAEARSKWRASQAHAHKERE